jgi:phosphopantothenoylcysteine decarboxylase/phosphopantothenate--cysteine ligase
LIATVACEKPYPVINVNSAQEMETEIKKNFGTSDILIMCAAVADYKVEKSFDKKIKKEKNETLVLNLVKNNDILKEISKLKKNNQIIIGFCAESEDLINNAKKKLSEKKLDFIVANDISRKDIGFNSEYNEVIILNKNGEMFALEQDLKTNIANKILEYCFS